MRQKSEEPVDVKMIEEAVDALIATRSSELLLVSPSDRGCALHTLLASGPKRGTHRKQRADQVQGLHKKQIKKIAEAARRLHETLDTGRDAGRLIDRRPEELRRMAWTMKVIAEGAARGELPSAEPAAEPANATHRFATEIAFTFLILTGREPTLVVRDGKAGGSFLDFLATVLAARRLTASAENCAKTGIAGMENMRLRMRA